MRRLLTSGLKAIIAVAVLSTAAHWAMRVQRDPARPIPSATALPDPVATGSIAPRRAMPAVAEAEPDVTRGLDQDHLLKLITNAASERPRVQKAVAARH